MKIEKISDTQVKFILSEEDLADRNIKLEDLAISSDKTKDLFQDILSKALDECGFSVDDAPLMVEALPVAMDSIMIIVTKLNDNKNEKSTSCSSLPIVSKDLHRYKRNSITIHKTEASDDLDIIIYSFEKLDDIIDVCARVLGHSLTDSSVYKNDGKYYFILHGSDCAKISHILNEYGNKEASNFISKYHIIEHGEVIVPNNAIEIFNETFVK
ncbi:adapter protein MecA 2 [Clostridiales bacterium]|nr:adapter protein MecA 2 [Clostridiales bacterium]